MIVTAIAIIAIRILGLSAANAAMSNPITEQKAACATAAKVQTERFDKKHPVWGALLYVQGYGRRRN